MIGKSQHQLGFSLVELMIALVLGLIVSGAVIEIFLNSKQMYRVQDERARLQENGRYAIELLSSNIRTAGYRGCATRSGVTTATNTLNDNTDYLWNFATGIEGFEATGSSEWTPEIDDEILIPWSGSDVLTVRTAQDPVIKVASHTGSGTAALQVNSQNRLQQYDVVMVTDCLSSAIFQITSANVNDGSNVMSLAHNTAAQDDENGPGNATQALGKNYSGGELMKLTTNSFYVRDSGDGIPSLFQRVANNAPTELIRGVESMQVLYGVDTDANEAADQYVSANDVDSWSDVVSVRISLLLRTLKDNLVISGKQTYSFNGSTVTAVDNRIRAIFSKTISLRNRVP